MNDEEEEWFVCARMDEVVTRSDGLSRELLAPQGLGSLSSSDPRSILSLTSS